MPSKELHVVAFILGKTSYWFRVSVPRASVFGNAKPEFLTMMYDEITGTEAEQALKIADVARATQAMAYMEGPALIIEDVDTTEEMDAEDLMAFRIIAMLDLLAHIKLPGSMTNTASQRLGWATITLQSFDIMDAEQISDKLLRRLGMYTAEEEYHAAARHCLTALRRAREDDDFLDQLWPEYIWDPGHGYHLASEDDEGDSEDY